MCSVAEEAYHAYTIRLIPRSSASGWVLQVASWVSFGGVEAGHGIFSLGSQHQVFVPVQLMLKKYISKDFELPDL